MIQLLEFYSLHLILYPKLLLLLLLVVVVVNNITIIFIILYFDFYYLQMTLFLVWPILV
jgi:hypothetical protein